MHSLLYYVYMLEIGIGLISKRVLYKELVYFSLLLGVLDLIPVE